MLQLCFGYWWEQLCKAVIVTDTSSLPGYWWEQLCKAVIVTDTSSLPGVWWEKLCKAVSVMETVQKEVLYGSKTGTNKDTFGGGNHLFSKLIEWEH